MYIAPLYCLRSLQLMQRLVVQRMAGHERPAHDPLVAPPGHQLRVGAHHHARQPRAASRRSTTRSRTRRPQAQLTLLALALAIVSLRPIRVDRERGLDTPQRTREPVRGSAVLDVHDAPGLRRARATTEGEDERWGGVVRWVSDSPNRLANMKRRNKMLNQLATLTLCSRRVSPGLRAAAARAQRSGFVPSARLGKSSAF